MPTTLAALGDTLTTFTTVFLGIFIEAAPFLMLGTVASGLVEVFFNQGDFGRLLPRNPFAAAVLGGMMGLAFPVCECGVVPLARRLVRKGLPHSAAIAFLLAAPVVNPIVIASTLAAFGPGPLVYGRVGLSLVIAIATGAVFAFQRRPEQLLLPASRPLIAGGAPDLHLHLPPARPASLSRRLRQVLTIAVDEFFEMGRYLVAGGLLAAGLQTVAPQSALLALGGGPLVYLILLPLLMTLLAGVFINLNVAW